MRLTDVLRIGFNVEILVCDARTGKLLKRILRHNLIPKVARNQVRDFLFSGAAAGNISHFAVGTGSTAPNANDVALGAEVSRAAITKKTSNDASITYQYYLGSADANGNDLTEAGLLNEATGGTLFARMTHQALTKTVSITITYNWTININAG